MKVLFLCTENACRSQMAEALTNHLFGDKVRAFSAGTKPGKVHPLTVKVLQEMGIPTDGLKSKSLEEVGERDFDLIVTLCDSAAAECPTLPLTGRRVHISLPDPSKVQGDEKEKLEAFRRVRDQLISRLKELFQVEE